MNTAGAVVLALVLALLAAAGGYILFTRIRASRLGLPPPPWSSYLPFLGSSSPSYSGPRPAPGGIVGWLSDRFRTSRLRNPRTAAGAYEGTSYNAGYAGYAGTHPGAGAGAGARGFDHLDDDPWDSRVGGYNPYDEERELGLAPPGSPGAAASSPYVPQGDGYAMNLPGPAEPSTAGAGTTAAAAAAATAATAGGAEEQRGRIPGRSPGPATPGAAARQGNPFDDDAAEPSNISLRGVSPRPMADQDASLGGRKARGEEERKTAFREEM
ncbi:hypothetical protein VTJ83DRAFT_4221 [Remersonia thermophila]|uniref:Uncharacterized protein n=1 Tax=Remersonia thermophila TaxID=72144 RepID=A0ABR4DA85_9PEZI